MDKKRPPFHWMVISFPMPVPFTSVANSVWARGLGREGPSLYLKPLLEKAIQGSGVGDRPFPFLFLAPILTKA
jgi:hypothetical protein